MNSESNYIEEKKAKAHRDSRREYSFMSELQMANEPLQCVLLLGRLNEAIETLSSLQDDYYTDYIWNAGNRQRELLEKNGFNEEWFAEVEDKMALLRTLLMGDAYNWEEAYESMYKVALGHEVYWRTFYEERTRKLEYELKKAKKGVTE